MPNQTPDSRFEDESGVATADETRVKRPRRFRVLIHNDDFTTMEFVVDVLEKFFQKDATEATAIMLSVHHKGVGLCGIFTREIAETKVDQVTSYAREHGMPLRCSMEAE